MLHERFDPLLPPDDVGLEYAIKQAVVAMRARYGADLVAMFLFGSRARGDYHGESDVDLAVVIEDARVAETGSLAFADLGYNMLIETGAALHFAFVSKSDWMNSSPSTRQGLVAQIRREAIDLLTPFWLD
jgi:antitoxin ChpS